MRFAIEEILETIRMIGTSRLDIRTVTLGVNLFDCSDRDPDAAGDKAYRKLLHLGKNLCAVTSEIEVEFGIPIVNTRLSVSPVSWIVSSSRPEDYVRFAVWLEKAACELGVNFIGGYSAMVQKGFSIGDRALVESIPQALSTTERVCSSVNVASTRAGINMDAVLLMGQVIKQCAEATADRDGLACAKLVVFANAVEDNPFMAGSLHGSGEPECVINIGVSGPGVVKDAVKSLGAEKEDSNLGDVAEVIKRTSFKITRMGELVGREISKRLGIPFGVVDVSLAPTPAVGDSVAEILEEMGLEACGGHGSTAALAMLVDAVKKGGCFASSSVGGLSGAFIPVSEDAAMIRAAEKKVITIEKLEAMTSVCSVGLDMIAVPGDTSAEILAGIIADEAAIGVINHKTTGVRIIPAPGKKVGDYVEFGGLLGRAPVMAVNSADPSVFVRRGGRIPAPIHSLRN